MHPREALGACLIALTACKPIRQETRLSEAVDDAALSRLLGDLEAELAQAGALSFTLEMENGAGMPVAAADLGRILPVDPQATPRPPKVPGDATVPETALALTDPSVPATRRPLVPAEMAARIQDFEAAIAESQQRTTALVATIEEYRRTVASYRQQADHDATVLASMEQSLTFQEQTLASLEASNRSLAALYDKALAALAAQNLRLATLEGDVSGLDAKLKMLADRIATVPILKPADDRPDITRLASRPPAEGVEFQDSAFFHHPRVEASFTRIDAFGVTGSVGFQGVFGGAQAAVHYEIRYGVETLVAAAAGIAAEGLDDTTSASIIRPLFTATGVTNRETSGLCIVFATHVVNPSTQLGVSLGPLSAAATASRLDQSDARRISPIFKNEKGVSFGVIKRRCDAFYAKVMAEAPPAGDLGQIRPEYVHRATACYSDIDCRTDLDDKIPGVQNYMIAECRHKAADRKGICETRVVEGGAGLSGNACHPTGYDRNFVWPCAKGLVCTGFERGYFSTTPGKCVYAPAESISDGALNGPGKVMLRNWRRGLTHVGLAAENVRHVGQLAVAVMTPAALAQICAANGLPPAQGWRLPSVRELWAIGVYDRERLRDREFTRLVKRRGFFRASDWYYAEAAFSGVIWSSDSFVYLKERQGTVPVVLEERETVAKLVAADAAGELYCVKGATATPGGDLGD